MRVFYACRKAELSRAEIMVVSVVHVFKNCQPFMKSGGAATRSQDPPLVAILSSPYQVRIPHSTQFVITIVMNMNVGIFKACSSNPRMSSSFCRLCQRVVHPSVTDIHLLGLFQLLPVTSNYAVWLFSYVCSSVYFCDVRMTLSV